MRSTPLKPGKPPKRSAMKRKRRRARPGKDFPKHLAFVRSLDCLIDGCPKPPVAHHLLDGHGGAGMTAPDFKTVPLCWAHHGELHSLGSDRAFEDRYCFVFTLEDHADEAWASSPVNPANKGGR